MMMSPIRPKPVLFNTRVASQPAIAPMTSVTIKPSVVIAVSPGSCQRIAGRMHNARRGNCGFFGPAQVVGDHGGSDLFARGTLRPPENRAAPSVLQRNIT